MPIRSTNKVRNIKEVSGKGFFRAPVVVFFPIVSTKVSSNSSSPIIITITFMKAIPGFLKESCGKKMSIY